MTACHAALAIDPSDQQAGEVLKTALQSIVSAEGTERRSVERPDIIIPDANKRSRNRHQAQCDGVNQIGGRHGWVQGLTVVEVPSPHFWVCSSLHSANLSSMCRLEPMHRVECVCRWTCRVQARGSETSFAGLRAARWPLPPPGLRADTRPVRGSARRIQTFNAARSGCLTWRTLASGATRIVREESRGQRRSRLRRAPTHRPHIRPSALWRGCRLSVHFGRTAHALPLRLGHQLARERRIFQIQVAFSKRVHRPKARVDERGHACLLPPLVQLLVERR